MPAPTWSTFVIMLPIRRLSQRRDTAGKPWSRRVPSPAYGSPIDRSKPLNNRRTEFSTQLSTHIHPAIRFSKTYAPLAADHQCGAPQSEILAGLDRLPGLVSR